MVTAFLFRLGARSSRRSCRRPGKLATGAQRTAIFPKEQPENLASSRDLALTNMGLGDKAAASLCRTGDCRDADRERRRFWCPPIEILARVAASTGETDRAIAALQQVLSIPGTGALDKYMPLTPALLRLDPMFDPLRNDPRFQKLAQSEAPKS